MADAKIFVRVRGKVGEGEKKPRFAVVGVAGTDLKIYAKHIRKMEIDQIAASIGADVVLLEAGQADHELDDDDD